MADLIIPTSTNPDRPHYTQRTTMDGRTYVLEFNWNGREARWYISIRDASGASIVEGIKVVVGWPLNRLVTGPGAPPGMLWALDTTRSETDPGLEELGERVLLIYSEAVELG